MHNYDFKNLNDKEFEVLANDLLSKREGVTVDRYKPGKDGGVDGRFFAVNGNEVIIQSKHWIKSGITALINHLQKSELPIIINLNPPRYILVTSLELSKANKEKIKATLAPYVKSEDDIVGQENLNDLISKNSDIEKKHFKLWLSSSAVLSIIFNNALTGRSEAKREEIVKAAEHYVATENHERAFKKLEDTHAVIITGEVGIGKTSLADQLALFYIAHDFELCVIEEDISEAEQVFKPELHQVFYFDDFLGRNFLTALQGKQDSHIINFIERVSRDKTKRFILTSRTTVLTQGKWLSDLFKIKKIDQNEYEITVESLSDLDKAKILYNHIWFGNLDEEHIDELYKQRRYLEVVKHPNYNPRIISFITDPSRLTDITSHDYWKYITTNLDNPQDVWANVFDNQIDDLMRLAVCLVVFNGLAIDENDFKEAFSAQALNDGLANKTSANNKLNKTLRNSVGATLNRTATCNTKEVKISLFNPSVADFVLGRYLDDHNSIGEFFFHLNTEASIENLYHLSKDNGLTSEGYTKTLRKLGSEKVSTDHLQAHTVYTLKLVRLLLENETTPSPDTVKNVFTIFKAINTAPVPDSCIEDACKILQFVVITEPHRSHQKVVNLFIHRCIKQGMDHDDLFHLDQLANKLHFDFQEATLHAIKLSIEKFWKDQINEIITNEEVLDQFMNHNEDDLAFKHLIDYLNGKLSGFDFTPDEITNIAECADIDEQIQANQDAASHDDDRYESWNRAELTSPPNDEALIDDLFQRD